MTVGLDQSSPRRAFTLIEMTAVIVVLGIVAGIATGIVLEAGRAYSRSNTRSDAFADARYALERMGRELADLAAATDISAMASHSVSFTLDGEERTFHKSGTDLLRDSNVLATGVSSFSLTYYKADGTLAASPAEVRRIAMEIEITRNDLTVSLRTEVFPRALRGRYVLWEQQ